MQLEESEGSVSVVLRHGLNTARLAMIFTALRKFDEQWSFHEMTCSDDDFRRVMAVMEVLLQHSLMLSTTLRREVAARWRCVTTSGCWKRWRVCRPNSVTMS